MNVKIDLFYLKIFLKNKSIFSFPSFQVVGKQRGGSGFLRVSEQGLSERYTGTFGFEICKRHLSEQVLMPDLD